MPKYLFILGQSPQLAQAELKNVLNNQSQIEIMASDFILAQTKKAPKELMSQLGGTIKIAKFLNQINNLNELTIEKWSEYLLPYFEKAGNSKINFGFSLYNASTKDYARLNKLALQLKKEFKNKNFKTRLVSSKEVFLSSVIVTKNKLINTELIIIKHNNIWLLGITKAVQDFVKYGYRDMKRPQRDNRSGMLPPKIAQMLLNLAGNDRNKLILDPFCGSGTILQEAILLGFKNVLGSDISDKAVNDTQQNLIWLKQTFNLKAKIKIINSDVKNLSQNFNNNSIDLIVTEPFMGDARFIQRQRQSKRLENTKNELQNLYTTAFKEFKKILKKNSLIVFIFPIFNINEQQIYTLDKHIISQLGFEFKKDIIYSRDKQKVQRQITLWKLS